MSGFYNNEKKTAEEFNEASEFIARIADNADMNLTQLSVKKGPSFVTDSGVRILETMHQKIYDVAIAAYKELAAARFERFGVDKPATKPKINGLVKQIVELAGISPSDVYSITYNGADGLYAFDSFGKIVNK